jgi:hypothetical protein
MSFNTDITHFVEETKKLLKRDDMSPELLNAKSRLLNAGIRGTVAKVKYGALAEKKK